MPAFIDLWLLDFEWSAPQVDGDEIRAWMEAEDLARLQRMQHPRRRAEFVLGRRLLRHALHERFGAEASRSRLRIGDKGRPYLQGGLQGDGPSPSISLSHCRSVIACAVGSPARLGLDVECVGRRIADFEKLAQAVFHPIEHESIATGPRVSAELAFIDRWVLKEALAKALGVGLSLPMREYAFVDDSLAASPAEFGDASAWHFLRPKYRDDIRLALAWETRELSSPKIALKRVALQNLSGD